MQTFGIKLKWSFDLS